jgi:hypothetical protein
MNSTITKLFGKAMTALHLRSGESTNSHSKSDLFAPSRALQGPDTVEQLIKSLRFFDPRLHVVVEGLYGGYEPAKLGIRVAGAPYYQGVRPGELVSPAAGVDYDPYSEQDVLVFSGPEPRLQRTSMQTVEQVIECLRACEPNLRVAVEYGAFSYEPIGLSAQIAGESPLREEPNPSESSLVDASVGTYRNPYCKREVLLIALRNA